MEASSACQVVHAWAVLTLLLCCCREDYTSAENMTEADQMAPLAQAKLQQYMRVSSACQVMRA